jgi:acyl-phosphate glycerol 3-phosphate acyltransferase
MEMETYFDILPIVAAYLLGSIPFGYIFTLKMTGKDIRKAGTGFISSTNVRRVAGPRAAFYTQLCDMLKGLLPVMTVWLLQSYLVIHLDEPLIYALALATILGHNFSIFMKFKGGKGINTTLGASLILNPIAVVASVLVYFIVKWLSGYVALGAICLAITLSVSGFFIHQTPHQFYYFLIATGLIIAMHIPNIKRLIKGTEIKSR